MSFFDPPGKDKKGFGGSFFSAGGPSAPTQLFDTGGVNRSIENALLRIRDAGYDIKDADDRNWFEKATNLPENQNAFFDVLELLGRPGSAVVNAINTGVKGGNSLEGAWRGFSGQDRTRGADLAETVGVDNGVGKFLLGTGLDIALDPLTYVPGGVIARGVGTVAKGAGKVGSAALNAIPGSQPFREAATSFFSRQKDNLGYGVVPDYKLGENLYGEADDAVLRAKQAAENDIAFRTEESMRRVADAAKTAGGVGTGTDVGRVMESGLKQFDEAGNEIPRPQRELPTEPNIQQAAQNLMQSNTELRQIAQENGINIKEMEGYMTHILAAEERKRRKNQRVLVDRGNFGTGQPNKSIFNKREHEGSVEDVNERMQASGRIKEGENFFEPNAFFATAVGQKRLIEYISSVNFRRQVLSNPKFALKYDDFKATGQPIPRNAVIIDTNNYKFIDDDSAKELGLSDEIGGQYIVTKAVKQALDRYQKLTTDEGVNSFLNAFDAAQSAWKRLVLFSVPYHLRNEIGAKFNAFVGGMSPQSLVKYGKQADEEVYNAVIKQQESPMYREFREQGLSQTGLSGVEFARRGEEPEDAIRRTIEKRSQFDGTLGGRLKAEVKSLKNPLNAFETSRDFGMYRDSANRYMVYKWARDRGMTPEQAAKQVRTMMFDYSRLTPLEREVFTRMIPFYRWMRNNIPFQIRQFIHDPRRYAAVNDIRLNAQEAIGLEDENMPYWLKENFAIPLYGEDGKGTALGLNLPLADLTKLDDPMKLLLDAVSPALKLPAELAMNRSFFFDKPIKEFEGQQKQYQIPGTDAEFGIDATLAYILGQAGGQPIRGLERTLQNESDKDQDLLYRMPTLGIGSMFKEINADQSRYYEKLNELQRLQDLIDYIEQQTGTRPRTVNEIR